jgi:CHRD domain-containing protein
MSRKVFPVVAACAVVFGTLAGLAAARGATTVKMTARLAAVSTQVVKTPKASGRYTATLAGYSNGRSKLTWALSYQHLSSRVLRAELVAPSTTNPVSVQLCKPCKASSRGVVNPILVRSTKALLTHKAYVVIYTKKNPKGEIRGWIARSH